MRILHLLNDIQNVGNGIVNAAVDLACLQQQMGNTVAIAAGPAQLIDRQRENATDYRELLAKRGVQYFFLDQSRTLTNLLRAVRQYRQIVRTFQPDIVHVHMITGAILAPALRLGDRHQVISTVHNEFQRSATLMGLADKVIAVSQAVAIAMNRRGVPQRKLHVVQNGTIGSLRQRPLEEHTAIPLSRPAIATVAGLYYRKGIAELIEGFDRVASRYSGAHLYIVGDGPERSQFEALAAASPFAARIHFEGFQPQPQRYLQSTDIFVLASRKDPCPLAISEAREAGCAIVASRVDGIPEALDNGAAGILTRVGDSQSIAQALKTLLEDPKTLAAWRRRAKQNLNHLSVQRMCQETLAVYEANLQLHSIESQRV